ncbi:MAG: hypothetical protein L0227_14705 [Chloroflexi bacterium]|nr:hypothetical protein [Chloroflexota bacterium]
MAHNRFGRSLPHVQVEGLPDGARVSLARRGRLVDSLRLGPNMVHAVVIHPDGSIDDCGVSPNLLTTDGRDLVAAGLGATGFGVSGTVATATTATSLTATGTPFVADAHKGWIVVAEESTNAPVWANIGSNTTSVLTVDAWRTGDDTAGTTPGATANYLILPSARARYIALSENATAPAASDTTLAGEITTGGLTRTLGTYAHTDNATTYTLSKTYSVTASFPALHKAGLFTASTLTAAGILLFASVLNQDANVANGDTLTATWTVTLS